MFSSPILLLITAITLLHSATTTRQSSSASCYICSGLNCAPRADHLSSCKSPTSADKVRCFFVAIDLDNIYRGCYEVNGTHVDFCRQHRLNYCRICRGQGCNNHPIYNDTPFSCRKCLSIGECHYSDTPEKITFHTCPQFFHGHVPRCFSYYYYGRLRYYFSCANEIPLQIRSSCSVDTFFSVCRYCDQPNCNDNDYFANFQMIPHYRNVCLRRDIYINCNLYTSLVPIMGCYWDEANSQDQGCINTIDYKVYGGLVREEYLQLCYDQQRCNQKNRDIHNVCLKNYDGKSISTSKCSVRWSRCMAIKYVDETGLEHNDRHCETRQYCSHPDECFYCDKSNDKTSPCNSLQLDSTVYSCFYCNSVKDCTTMNPLSTNRTHLCADKDKQCFTHLNVKRGTVVRGCYAQGSRDEWQRDCDLDEANCEICKGAFCNGKSTKMFCYVCSGQSSLCRYDQVHQAISLCPGGDTLRERIGCFTNVRQDGQVERGCFRGNFTCPDGHSNCTTCESIGCNNRTFQSGQCLECSGPTNEPCGQEEDYLALESISKLCPVHIGVPLCYVAYSENNSVIERGCTARRQYKVWLQPACDRRLMNCSFCNESNCNYFVMELNGG